MFTARDNMFLDLSEPQLRALNLVRILQDLFVHCAKAQRRIRIFLTQEEFHAAVSRFAEKLELSVNGVEQGLYELEHGRCGAATLALQVWGADPREPVCFSATKEVGQQDLVERAARSRAMISMLTFKRLLDAAAETLPATVTR